MPDPTPHSPAESEPGRGCLPALVRLTWIFGGIGIVFTAVFIAQDRAGLIADISPFALALLLIIVRFVDIKYLRGETMDNKPATLRDWSRYALVLLVTAGVLFALGKVLARTNIF